MYGARAQKNMGGLTHLCGQAALRERLVQRPQRGAEQPRKGLRQRLHQVLRVPDAACSTTSAVWPCPKSPRDAMHAACCKPSLLAVKSHQDPAICHRQ
jgi:hypothetical protein